MPGKLKIDLWINPYSVALGCSDREYTWHITTGFFLNLHLGSSWIKYFI